MFELQPMFQQHVLKLNLYSRLWTAQNMQEVCFLGLHLFIDSNHTANTSSHDFLLQFFMLKTSFSTFRNLVNETKTCCVIRIKNWWSFP